MIISKKIDFKKILLSSKLNKNSGLNKTNLNKSVQSKYKNIMVKNCNNNN